MIRLFTGLSLPPTIVARLQILSGGVPGARWVVPANFHITLSFVGEVDEGTAADIDAALEEVSLPGFTLRLDGFGHFKRGDDPTTLYAAVTGPAEFLNMKEKINRALERAAAPYDTRKYTPHVTLAYLKHADTAKIADFVEGHSPFRTEPFDVTSFHLYQSHATKNGSVYEILRTYPLNRV